MIVLQQINQKNSSKELFIIILHNLRHLAKNTSWATQLIAPEKLQLIEIITLITKKDNSLILLRTIE